ncbi:hypothetical protein WOLCODRAFT_163865 [Wolfiporia cocos MD-104 SS10]|uniref:Arrestin-like N-terminal domain-containing protein n=1 Tax=Wolfiporia cocos (strain MD-104) TaxID=742152 RepID=A0A2H3K0K6_WOLCO|nr:hypothetical protein WOLCODRAFT_163865 [Wolfiporia cocos MD-104 SS10]
MVVQVNLELMNASPHHAKVRVSLKLANSLCIAGGTVTGRVELENKADMGLGFGVIMVELFAVEELTSRDHSATSTFLHTRRLFQGPGLPPSNAVHPSPIPGEPPLPTHYYPGRRGITTFPFRLPTPGSSPSAINFGSGLAQVRYEVRASVGVAWKGENKLVFDRKSVDVVERYNGDPSRTTPEAVIVGENGKIWAQAKVTADVLVAGQSGCIELTVKNHSSKKNSGLSLSLRRELHLPNLSSSQKQPLQISDTLTSVSFKGPEYIIQPGVEGVANLVFDLPKNARGVKGGLRQSDEEGGMQAQPLFEVRCTVEVRLTMGIGSKDIVLNVPVTILDPLAMPSMPYPDPYTIPLPQSPQPYNAPTLAMAYPSPAQSPVSHMGRPLSPYAYVSPPVSPPPQLYISQGQVWLPPPVRASPPYYSFYPPLSPPIPQHYYHQSPTPRPLPAPYAPPPRPSSAEPIPSQPKYGLPSGSPPVPMQQPLIPLHTGSTQAAVREEGKGERASRITYHLRMSSRHRSTSPPAHRYPIPAAPEVHASAVPPPASASIPIPIHSSRDVPQTRTEHSPSSSPGTQRNRNLTIDVSVSPARSQGSVVSPRPMLSPKHSFSSDLRRQSTQVEQLERIAAQVESGHADLSGSGGAALEADMKDKTLPRVPSDTKKSVRAPVRNPVDTLLPAAAARPEETPPTPTLAAVMSLKVPRSPLGASDAINGLDALEAKLLAEVGTRKMEKTERPAVRSVLPINIPPRPAPADPADDSAISSLTLPGLEDARTPEVGFLKADHELEHEDEDDDRALTERWRDRDHEQVSKENRRSKGSSDHTRKSKDKKHGDKRSGEHGSSSKGEFQRLKKTAQGRVAEWLGSIVPDVPPPPDSPPQTDAHEKVAEWLQRTGDPSPLGTSPPVDTLLTDDAADVAATRNSDVQPDTEQGADSSRSAVETVMAQNGSHKEETPNVLAAPNPRSSGFMPIGTIRTNMTKRPSPSINDGRVYEASREAIEKPKVSQVSPRLPRFPPRPLDPEVRYDIRSARGGRGGKVAAVAAIWASAQQNEKANPVTKPPPRRQLDIATPRAALPTRHAITKLTASAAGSAPDSSPRRETRPPSRNGASSKSATPSPLDTKSSPAADLTAKRARMIKSAYVPAVVSSSLATPMLSSTASLARPPPSPTVRAKLYTQFAPRIVEEEPQPSTKADESKPPAPKVELAFGQARLRELIRRYQGQANV